MDGSGSQNPTNPLDAYESLEVIGTGSFGTIRKVRRRSDGVVLARKELNFERMTERDRKQIVAEVNILKELDHDHIVAYHDRFVDRENGILYIVMEYCGGGDLGSVITRCRRENTMLPEDTIWSYFLQIVLALHSCHHPGVRVHTGTMPPPEDSSLPPATERKSAILHRDLKPENVFLNGENQVKLGDFGLSKQLPAATMASTYVGTPYYMSPEVMQEKAYDSKSDIWSLGCLLFELCALNPPFHQAQTHTELAAFIRKGQIPPLPRCYSSSLMQVIKAMLNLNPALRPSAMQLLQHEKLDLAFKTSHLDKMMKQFKQMRTTLAQKETEMEQRDQARIAEFQAYLAVKEEEVRAVMDAREIELREAMIRRESELCQGVLQREEELRQRWEEREEEIRVAWERREAELVAEITAREDILRRRELELEEREKALGESGKAALKDVKNTTAPNRQQEKQASAPVATAVPPKTPISRFISKSAVEGLSPTEGSVATEPGSAMKGVVLTETGEALPTPGGAAGRNLQKLLMDSPIQGIQLDFSRFANKPKKRTSQPPAENAQTDHETEDEHEEHDHKEHRPGSPCPAVRTRKVSVVPKRSLPVPVSSASPTNSSQDKENVQSKRPTPTTAATAPVRRPTLGGTGNPAAPKPERRTTLATAAPFSALTAKLAATTLAEPMYDFNDEENLPSPFIKRNVPQATRAAPLRPRPSTGAARPIAGAASRLGAQRTRLAATETKKAAARTG